MDENKSQAHGPHDAQDERPDAAWHMLKEMDIAIKRLKR